MKARQLPRPVRVYFLVRERGGESKRQVLFERAMLLGIGTDSEEVQGGVLVYSVGVIECPDGTMTTAALNMIQFLDVGQWKPVTGPGQVHHGDRLRFTVGDNQHQQRAKSILHWGTDREEVVYDKGRNFYFITSMVANGSSNHKGVEYFDTRGE